MGFFPNFGIKLANLWLYHSTSPSITILPEFQIPHKLKSVGFGKGKSVKARKVNLEVSPLG